MKKITGFLLFIFLFLQIKAQVGIGTATPDPSAQLEVQSANKGILIPRVALTGTNDNTTITTPQISLLVYNSATAGTGPTAVTPGFYYWNGTAWQSMIPVAPSSSWNLNGNYGTTSANFIGPNDLQPLYFKIDGQQSGLIDFYSEGTFFGFHAGITNMGNYNSAFGEGAMGGPTSVGGFNAAFGAEALNINSGGHHNSAVGDDALHKNSVGSFNTAVGQAALHASIDADNNTAIGYNAGGNNIHGWNNTCVGSGAGPSTSTLNNTVAIGSGAVVTADNNIVIGNAGIASIGGFAPWTNLSDIRFKTDVQEETHGLDLIMKLRPITYHLNIKKLNQFLYHEKADSIVMNAALRQGMDAKERILYSGFSAQQVEEAANTIGYNFSAVHKPANAQDHYALDYSGFVVPLVKAVQEQQQEIEKLKSENGSWKQKYQMLADRVEKLEQSSSAR